MHRTSVAPLFALFALSGFTGLIYESLWSHYLKLFLGHAAFAQSFVLIMFMGGMAAGAWIAARRSDRMNNLLAAYALIEALIGAIALVFHEVFVFVTDLSLESVIPALGDPTAVELWKHMLSALLLLPQTVLLGMTFPLMSGAVIRRSPAESGHHLAMLYFTNSIGAAAGALVSAFWLLGALGLPGTMRLAGGLNLVLALLVLLIARRGEPRPLAAPVQPATAGESSAGLFLWAAFVTGAASFVYEIAWVRMLSLVLGSSFQAFELMLSAFITGLALGGLWIRRRIDTIADPVRFGGYVQIVMGALALGTLAIYHQSFEWMSALMGALKRNDASYTLFNLGSHAIAFAIMLPATFMAGMTLPLFTHVLMRRGRGERAIGQIYAGNTLGAIAGVLLTVHILMPEFGLKLALVIGACADIVLGGWLLRWSGFAHRRIEAMAMMLAGLLLATLTARAAVLDPARMSAGVFRHGQIDTAGVDIAYYRDGKTASIALRDYGAVVAITTNGKPDAGVQMNPAQRPSPDEWTMTLLAAIPLLMKPEGGVVANVGFGSGLTGEVLLSHDKVREIDTIEIEPAMVDAARGFAPRVTRMFDDPRSRIHIEDAKTFFARHGKRYDIIVSEPSNPWVSGVGNLFSTEFYRDVRRHLAPGGLLVQWMHIYEMDDRLLGSVLAAMEGSFSDYAMFEIARGDLLIVATAEGRVPALNDLPAQPSFRKMLERIGIRTLLDVQARQLGDKRSLGPLFAARAAPANSDFRPVLQLDAPKARFMGKAADDVMSVALAPLPILEMLAPPALPRLTNTEFGGESDRLVKMSEAIEIGQVLVSKDASPFSTRNPDARLPLAALKGGTPLCRPNVEQTALAQMLWAAEATLAYLPDTSLRSLWSTPAWAGCGLKDMDARTRVRFELFDAVARRDAAAMLALGSRGAQSADADLDWRRYALLAAMLGARALGKDAEADALWKKYQPGLYKGAETPGFVRYLVHWRGGPRPAG